MYVLLIVVCAFVLFLLAIVLSVLLRYTDSDYPFVLIFIFIKFNYCMMICYYMKINLLMYDISRIRWMKRKKIIICVKINKSHHGYSCTYEPVRKLTKQNEIWTNLRTHFFIKINPRKIVSYASIFNASLTISSAWTW
jgi:hypothetical protein